MPKEKTTSSKIIFKKKVIFNKKSLNANIFQNNTKTLKPIKPKTSHKIKKIDFDPFGIYPNDLELGKPILLVDLGYTTFYRFNATKTWYKNAHPEELDEIKQTDYQWADNSIFMEMFNKRYVNSILEISQKYKIPKHNVILAQDCSSCDNWRGKLYKDYKLTRKQNQIKYGFDGKEVFKSAHSYTFNAMAENYGFKLIKHKDIEADDVNAIITQYYQKHYPKVNVYILATDKDYLQLSNGYFHLIDFKGKILNVNSNDLKLGDGKYQLWYKILIGDKSDNIPAIKIQRKYVRPHLKSNDDTYIYINKKDGAEIATNIKQFLKNIKQDPNIINQEQLNLNKTLIDFDCIPTKYQKYIVNVLEKNIYI
jgi:5'-3' exonuclease